MSNIIAEGLSNDNDHIPVRLYKFWQQTSGANGYWKYNIEFQHNKKWILHCQSNDEKLALQEYNFIIKANWDDIGLKSIFNS